MPPMTASAAAHARNDRVLETAVVERENARQIRSVKFTAPSVHLAALGGKALRLCG
jgi:hypothetical protein